MKIRTVVAALALMTAAACGSATESPGGSAGSTAKEVRLGYFPNITHSTALVGTEKGLYAKHLGVPVKTSTFNAGPAAIEAIFSGAIDATYIGPNPAINAWAKSKGEAIKIVAGSASGGVYLVTKPEINGVADLKGKKIATPQLGNTQDVALRYWLKQNGLNTDTKGGGDVHIVPQENAQTLQTFATGDIDGAWVPEPFASRLVLESKGKILLDERELWPGKQFVITHLIVRQAWAKENPDLLKKLIEAHVEATKFINDDPAAAATTVNAAIEKLTQKPLKQEVLDSAFKNITFTNDPIASSLTGSAEHAIEVGLLEPVDLNGIYDLKILNEVLAAQGQQSIKDK
ncbi:ABC transporter substrate-binding protein [Nonomuraea soli]|uniref:NitT/TauT family transport system substrate-binding protein n=1 Tax=Nonomuraea soli TaxID=1032476 RepID=A0A7W0CIW3_9ACTN|nr:ABC transporter substrate-binding protein [Nonomuraea soli]MBA2891933.1 NitT/TauT family transport system substrate-binding protein [Nonomuraea soli]